MRAGAERDTRAYLETNPATAPEMMAWVCVPSSRRGWLVEDIHPNQASERLGERSECCRGTNSLSGLEWNCGKTWAESG